MVTYEEMFRNRKGQFIKGMNPWNKGLTKETDKRVKGNKGFKHSQETKIKIGNINRNKHYSSETEFKKGQVAWNKGLHPKRRCLSEEEKIIRKEKMIIKETLAIGKKSHFYGERLFGKGNPFYGKTHSEEHKKRLGEIMKKLRMEGKLVLPKKDTSIEVKIQNFLKQLGIEFLTHQYIKDIEHGYQCDIMIPIQEGINKKTIIECFGTYWHNYPLGKQIDIQRCNELRKAGWRVLVFWENEIRVMESNELGNKLFN